MSSAEGTCNGTSCYISCSCKSGWSSVSSYSNRAASGNAYIDVTAPRTYAKGTPTCRKYVGCSDYEYKSELTAGYYGTEHTITTDGSDLTCYKDSGKCAYSCPSGYYNSASNGYKLTTTSKKKTLNKYDYHNCNATNTEDCYTQTAKTCDDYGYKDSIPSGQTCTEVQDVQLGSSTGTCYTACKDGYYDYKIVYGAYADSDLVGTVKSVSIKIKWNGAPMGPFTKTRGEQVVRAKYGTTYNIVGTAEMTIEKDGTIYDCNQGILERKHTVPATGAFGVDLQFFCSGVSTSPKTVTFKKVWTGCGTHDRYSDDPNANNPACGGISGIVFPDGGLSSSSGTRWSRSVPAGTTVIWRVKKQEVSGCGTLNTSGWSCSGDMCTLTRTIGTDTTLTASYKCGS